MTRIAIIHKEKCNPYVCGNLCKKICPVNKKGEECININKGKAEISEELCIGCGICQNRCPFQAISIIKIPEKLEKNLVFRYEKNGFCLYNLPTPKFGYVLGLLGKNGIGKSTAIKILANKLKINLGKEHAEEKEIKKFLQGKEILGFFEKIENLKIAYKPQLLVRLKKSKVRVSELLEKLGNKKQIEKITKKLFLTHLKNRELNKLSGGELQKVAIAAASIKEVDLYFFDEPLAYLDIEERIKVSNFIRELIKQNKAVIVVEHDLLLLDYITDYINIFYGKPTDYGAISGLKPTKGGINSYLDGFLKEENIRFRNKKIEFFKFQGKIKSQKKVFEWSDFSKTFEDFTLKVKKGSINESSVIGILGKNGIGKTTFVECIAGMQSLDNNEKMPKIKISYKPQYLTTDSKEFVAEIIKKEKINNRFRTLFSLDNISLKRLNELSGGELQRVYIAKCLAKEADIYLIDEPSAHLDVEERLNVAKAINNIITEKGKSAFVVDHDLLFLSYVSDSLITFSGESGKFGMSSEVMNFSEGLNLLLKELKITIRRDKETLRPKINKLGSVLDREQKEKGEFFED